MHEKSATPDLVELTRGFYEALNRRDLDAAQNLFAPDAVYEAVSLGATFEGAEEIRRFIEDWLGAYTE
jgi:ketosteroid isomerase-like protein